MFQVTVSFFKKGEPLGDYYFLETNMLENIIINSAFPSLLIQEGLAGADVEDWQDLRILSEMLPGVKTVSQLGGLRETVTV